ncbi:MAG: hypothetical protein KY455_09630 [Euryarchaeota archaeon]|nr:hypothetical protein [Euryarchaeota archaeon]
MDDPVETHFQMVDRERSLERLRQAVTCLEAMKSRYVVEGGWAVAAYGSPVPSVDLDVLVPGGLTEEIADAIEAATGIQMFSQATHDELSIDFVDMDLPNRLIDRAGLSYVPSAFIGDHTETREITIVPAIEIVVPTAPRLVFMKLKALPVQDSDTCWPPWPKKNGSTRPGRGHHTGSGRRAKTSSTLPISAPTTQTSMK